MREAVDAGHRAQDGGRSNATIINITKYGQCQGVNRAAVLALTVQTVARR